MVNVKVLDCLGESDVALLLSLVRLRDRDLDRRLWRAEVADEEREERGDYDRLVAVAAELEVEGVLVWWSNGGQRSALSGGRAGGNESAHSRSTTGSSRRRRSGP